MMRPLPADLAAVLALLAFLVAGAASAGCAALEDTLKGQPAYMIDHRTGLCFAVAGVGQNWAMTHVPCTPEVLALIGGAP